MSEPPAVRRRTPFLLATLLLCLGTTWLAAGSAPASGIPDYRFGVVEAYAAPSSASALGAGWQRVTFEWARIQPNSPDEWVAEPLSDGLLAHELALGRQVVGLLITIPHWAIDPATGLPQGLYLPPDDPGNLWAGFVRQIVGCYAGRVDHWIVWNEPEIPLSSPDASWPGSIPDFIQLLRIAYGVAKTVNPGATIHMAAVSHYHDPDWYNRFLETLIADPAAAQNDYYFDVASLNLYHEPEKIYDITAHYIRMLHGKGLQKPLWITETNAYLSRVSETQQAIFMVQAFSLEIAAGASRMAVYKMIDTESDKAADPEPFGLVRADGSPRPAFTAYRTAATHLAGFRGGSWERRDSVAVVTIDRGPRTTTVVWSRTPEHQTVEIAALAERALAVDVWGAARTIYAQDGRYVMEVGGADCSQGCVMGGPPLMLVEELSTGSGAAPPAPSPTPIPDQATQSDEKGTVMPSPASPLTEIEATSTRRPAEMLGVGAWRTKWPAPTPTHTPSPKPTACRTLAPSATLSSAARPTPTQAGSPTSTVAPSPTNAPMPADRSTGQPWAVVLAGAGAVTVAGLAAAAAIRRRAR